MKTLKLISISEVKEEKERTDGKISRKYYTAYFSDSSNPFAKPQQRNVFQQHNDDGDVASWKGGDPAIVKGYVGKEIPGQILNCEVEPYSIKGRTINSFTTVLLDGENLTAVLKQSGHVLASNKKEEVKSVTSLSALNA